MSAHNWGKLLDQWHDEGRIFHMLKNDWSPACGVTYRTTTGPYPRPEEDCYPRCRRCEAIAKARNGGAP